MASVKAVCCLLVTTVLYATAGSSFVTVKCQRENHGVYGQQSMVQCAVKLKEEVADTGCFIKLVIWKKEGKTLFKFLNNTSKSVVQGFKFAEPTWNSSNMNVSLLLTNTKLTDNGAYQCTVDTDRGNDRGSTSLQVTAKYEQPTMSTVPEKPIENTDVSIFCNTTGGHQKGRIDWFDEYGTNWTKSSELAAETTKDGLFRLSSKFTVQTAVHAIKYRCVVYNANEVQEGETTLDLQFLGRAEQNASRTGPDAYYKVLAPAVVIGSLIVGLLFALLIFKRRSNSDHQEIDADVSVEAAALNPT